MYSVRIQHIIPYQNKNEDIFDIFQKKLRQRGFSEKKEDCTKWSLVKVCVKYLVFFYKKWKYFTLKNFSQVKEKVVFIDKTLVFANLCLLST